MHLTAGIDDGTYPTCSFATSLCLAASNSAQGWFSISPAPSCRHVSGLHGNPKDHRAGQNQPIHAPVAHDLNALKPVLSRLIRKVATQSAAPWGITAVFLFTGIRESGVLDCNIDLRASGINTNATPSAFHGPSFALVSDRWSVNFLRRARVNDPMAKSKAFHMTPIGSMQKAQFHVEVANVQIGQASANATSVTHDPLHIAVSVTQVAEWLNGGGRALGSRVCKGVQAGRQTPKRRPWVWAEEALWSCGGHCSFSPSCARLFLTVARCLGVCQTSCLSHPQASRLS